MASTLRRGLPLARTAPWATIPRSAFTLASRPGYSTSNAQSAEERLEAAKLAKNKRPSSPHFTIYQPQLTWYLSIAHRITGVSLATGKEGAWTRMEDGGFYAGAMTYAFVPGLDSAAILSMVASAPAAATIAAKFIIAWPVTFHSLNGIRHLVWDTGRELSLKGVYRTGYAVLGASAASALALTML
ncbi:MAG: hypothetical protein DHS80DRAFT_23686 [Piptocephalis tieghemiana]|nr:MAG: hypothetical protein DHS80DRAFT_23686 [Piptocephalis tieghemiana]